MNSKQFLVLFASVAIMKIVDCTLDPIVVNGLAVNLPLISATAGTLSLPLAVLGILKLAAALKLSGVTLATLKGGNSETYEEPSSGYGRYRARSLRPGHQGPRAGRGKRSAEETEAIFSLVSSMDMYSCGKALVCALEAKDSQSLGQDEQIIMALFADRKSKSLNVASAKIEYELAAELGLATKDEVACRKRYSTCPYTADEMMGALRDSQL